jgi:hexosaminidase
MSTGKTKIMNKITLYLVCLLIPVSILAQEEINIIPKPQKAVLNGQSFQMDQELQILFDDQLEDLASYFSATLSPPTGWDFETIEADTPEPNTIFLSINNELDMGDEGYRISVTSEFVQITGKKAAGVFYGIQSFLQLLPVEIYNNQRQKDISWVIQGVEIEDNPSYPWRGIMLDVGRYFFDKDYVFQLIDKMSMYKMNVLHLHLIDDSGWRLEIKKYPKLTEIGGWRGEGHERTGGYYTQEDIKEIVGYAALRNVEVVPEIEIPAHTLSAIAAYPYLSCNEQPQKVQVQHSISRELYCVGKETTFEFLEDVFEEAAGLFPSKYVHIGGDEARYDRWEACPHCQKRKKDLGLDDEKELQVYFTGRVQQMLKKHGKTIVGWDEIIEGGLEEKVVGMVWHNPDKGIRGTRDGHDMVMALTQHCYFDMPESDLPGEVKAGTWLPPISLEKVYSFNPMIEGIEERYRSQILGGHATLWTDQFIHGYILQEIPLINENRSEKYMDYLTLPRLTALAEVCWTDNSLKDYNDFLERLQTHYNRFDQAGYGYRVPLPQLSSMDQVDDGFRIALESMVHGAEIHYTTNGILPNVYSPVYTGPVTITDLSDFQAITVVNRHQYSLPLFFPEEDNRFKEYGAMIGEWTPDQIQDSQYTSFEMNATGKITQNGVYELFFWYTGGSSRLDIESIEILKNGKKIAKDKHFGYSGENSSDNMYTFEIKDYETGAAFTVRAQVRSATEKDSNGKVFIRLKE